MTLEQVLVWMVVGLIAGWLASSLITGGLGIVGDIVLGIAGSFLGSLIFRTLGWHAPFPGRLGMITVAFLGAAVLLLALRVVRRGRRAA